MSLAYHCQICSGANPKWYLMRRGDAVVTWACAAHLDSVIDDLQRDWEVTEVIVRGRREGVETP